MTKEKLANNTQDLVALTKHLARVVSASSSAAELNALPFATEHQKILRLNRKLISELDPAFFVKLAETIKKFTLLKMVKYTNEDLIEYFAAVIDIFARPAFLQALEGQFTLNRRQHGMEGGVIKHIWCVSFLSFIRTKNRTQARLLARIGLYHDIALHHSRYHITDFDHPRKSAIVARRCGEPSIVVDAVRQHLVLDMLRGKQWPRSKEARRIMFFDTLLAVSERTFSLGAGKKKLSQKWER